MTITLASIDLFTAEEHAASAAYAALPVEQQKLVTAIKLASEDANRFAMYARCYRRQANERLFAGLPDDVAIDALAASYKAQAEVAASAAIAAHYAALDAGVPACVVNNL